MALNESNLDEVSRLLESGLEQTALANVYDRDERHGLTLDKSDRRKRDRHRARAADLKAQANALREASSRSGSAYPPKKLEQWAASAIKGQNEATAKMISATRHEDKYEAEPPRVRDHLLDIRFTWRAPDTPKSIDKCLSELPKIRDARAAILSTRRHFDLLSLPIDIVHENVMRVIDKAGPPPNVAPAFKLVRDLAGRRSPGEVKWQQRKKIGAYDTFEPDPLAILFWICGPQIKKAVGELLAAAAPADSMTVEHRARGIAELDRKLADLEPVESALTWRLIQAGHKISHRHDMAPANVLLVDVSYGDKAS